MWNVCISAIIYAVFMCYGSPHVESILYATTFMFWYALISDTFRIIFGSIALGAGITKDNQEKLGTQGCLLVMFVPFSMVCLITASFILNWNTPMYTIFGLVLVFFSIISDLSLSVSSKNVGKKGS